MWKDKKFAYFQLYNTQKQNYLCQFMKYNAFNYRKDVRLPVQLQRAMAAEAEAAREARAKVK